MSVHQAAAVIADKLRAAGIEATEDPRAAAPPCVLVAPPTLTFDVGCGATGTWTVVALAPGPFNRDAWLTLDELLAVVVGVAPVESARYGDYTLAADNPPMPACLITFTQGVDL